MKRMQQHFHDLYSFCSQSMNVIQSIESGLIDNWGDIAHVKLFAMTDGRNDFVTGNFSGLEISTHIFFKITSEALPYRLIVDHPCIIEIRDSNGRNESEGRKICYIPTLYRYTLIQVSRTGNQLRLTAVSLQELAEITSNARVYGHNGASMSKRLQQLQSWN